MKELSFEEELGFFRNVVDYEDYEKGLRDLLGRCHSQEELDTAKVAIDEVKDRLMESDKEFKQILDNRKRDAQLQADMQQAIHRATMSEARSEGQRTHQEALAKVPKVDIPVDDWVAKTRYKTYDPEEKKKSIKAGIGCPNPKCKGHGKNKGNVMNNTPTCMACFHKLVPKSEFKDYNRKYWRRFNKKNKKRLG